MAKLLIVCLGNTRRSPLAEEILSARGATVDSAGIIVIGATTCTGGYPKVVTQELIDWADVVYGMTDKILTKLNDRFEGEFTKFDSESDIPDWEKYEEETGESDDMWAWVKAEGEHIKRIAELMEI